nr:hypothetical protein [Clostridia bacterium]
MDSLRGILLSEPTYEEIVKLDESLDIATEIEHMIEVGEIVSVLTVTGTTVVYLRLKASKHAALQPYFFALFYKNIQENT